MFNRQKSLTLLAAFLFLIGIGGFFVRTAWSDAVEPVRASATFDWSTFQIMGVDIGHGTPSVTWDWKGQYVEAEANGYWDDDSALDWTTDLYVSQSDNGAYAEAYTYPDQIGSSSSVLYVDPGESNDSWAGAERYGGFTVSGLSGGPGLVVFMVDYTLQTSISQSAGLYDAEADSGAYMSVYDDSGRWSDSGDWIWQWLGEEDQYKTDTLSVAMLFEDGQSGYFYADAYTDAYAEGSPVPIPSAILLFGPGLFCVGVLRKRQKE